MRRGHPATPHPIPMQCMLLQVNFDEEDEAEQSENRPVGMSSQESSVQLLRTPLHPIISAAVGARAISTPDGMYN